MATSSQHLVVRSARLTKRYGVTEVVSGVGLEVPAGQVYGFLGPNGAGKSTTMKMLLGLTRPSVGSVEVFGEPFSPQRTLARVGSLIEQPSFYGHLTGRENLDIVRRVKHLPASSVGQALDTVGLSHAGDKLARAYSLGMKQRLGLAMALLGDPELLVLDEPTNGLDPSGIHEIRDLITSLPRTRGITVLVSSHLLSEIEQMADTIGIITQGHLVYQGPLSALREAGRLVVRVNTSQAVPAARELAAQGWQVGSVEDGEITLPAYSDEHVARLVTTLVSVGTSIYRVELRRRSLEQIFLDITEQAPPQSQPTPTQPGAPRHTHQPPWPQGVQHQPQQAPPQPETPHPVTAHHAMGQATRPASATQVPSHQTAYQRPRGAGE
ncbi:ABC transporter ATP-binding protein [Actinomyces wuliandei]|uniref:ABC transporter ATP-binding protein n=1 Tax=Actinomyces wuliandei TaxID=2057743 RepID=UPI00111920A7|nr:ABC transporter ATP-binding protein [Actinomyces wuliandei]